MPAACTRMSPQRSESSPDASTRLLERLPDGDEIARGIHDDRADDVAARARAQDEQRRLAARVRYMMLAEILGHSPTCTELQRSTSTFGRTTYAAILRTYNGFRQFKNAIRSTEAE